MGPCMSPILTIIEFGRSYHQVCGWTCCTFPLHPPCLSVLDFGSMFNGYDCTCIRCVGLCVQEWCPRWPGLAQLTGQMAWGLWLPSRLHMVYRWLPMGPCMSLIQAIIEFGWSLLQVCALACCTFPWHPPYVWDVLYKRRGEGGGLPVLDFGWMI